MIGVPCLATWRSGPSSRMVCPYSLRRRKAMKRGPARIEISIAARPAIRTRTKLGLHRRQRFRHLLEREHAGALDEYAVARLQLLPQRLDRLGGVGGRAATVDPRLWADGDQDVDADLFDCAGDLAMSLVGVIAELRHLSEHGDAPMLAGALGEVLERGADRDRVGVPGVVDQQPSTG